MRVAFTADLSDFDADEYGLVVGLEGEGHYLVFQRDAEGSVDGDWGIHLEYDDQSCGGYESVGACRIGPANLSVDLVKQLGGLSGVTGFDVALELSPEQLAAVREGLRQVFRGNLDKLTDDEPSAAADGSSSEGSE